MGVESALVLLKRRATLQQAHRSTDLAPDERVAVERLLGRPLRNDEAIEVVTHKLDDLRHVQ